MTSGDPNYTVAVCNYNMAKTLEESLRSILDQIDERFEVLVIDDGSTDSSQEILDRLDEEYEALRWIEGDNDNIGEARAMANREARGEYVIAQLDADDKIKPVIQDMVKMYHKVEKEREGMFWMNHMAPRDLLLDTNYRSMGRGEDRDLKRRLLAKDAFLPLKRNSIEETLGYNYGKIDKLKNGYETTKNIFRSGVKPFSYIKWKITNAKYRDDIYRAIITPIAFIQAKIEGIYNLPEEYERFGKRWEENHERQRTLNELEQEYDIEIEPSLSEEGRKALYLSS